MWGKLIVSQIFAIPAGWVAVTAIPSTPASVGVIVWVFVSLFVFAKL
jgi:hypothetical protein